MPVCLDDIIFGGTPEQLGVLYSLASQLTVITLEMEAEAFGNPPFYYPSGSTPANGIAFYLTFRSYLEQLVMILEQTNAV